MIPIGNHGLECPTDGDYGALALMMQQTALTTEAALVAQKTKLDAYVNRPAMCFTSTITSSYAAAGGELMPDGRDGNPASFTGSTQQGGGFTVLSSTVNILLAPPSRAGWYDVGGYYNGIPAGVVNVGTERLIYVRVFQVNVNPTISPYTFFSERTTETNTGGGEFLNTSGLVYLNNINQVGLAVYESHANVGSNLVIQTGAKLWIQYWGPKGAFVTNA